ncbi:hypothetical protein SAMN02745119_03376 [Trichlorobacter thiogenes]|uniref:Uncharacterized protein n=1 Tax=Trichlorobacter thiogenes TaxID=115783 RepID=A0A1T4SAN0_9BACT|nr:hypothetical protein [Trichlorobacter thiogenes]SKA25299.1 hypothetical protein SAMN02745119_03376 [Trichlorobacter thiogenes]
MKNCKRVKPERHLLLAAIVAFCIIVTASLDVVQATNFPAVVPVISATNNTKYVAGNIYTGKYNAKALYYRHNTKQPWMRWSKSDNYQQDVTCAAALASLDSTGVWSGNLGVRGACGTTAEPAIFAIGNYLNQNTSLDSVGAK